MFQVSIEGISVSVPDTLLKFWNHQEDVGRRPAPVWAMVSLGMEQPKGFVKGWSVSKTWIEGRLNQEPIPSNWSLVKITGNLK